MNCPRFLRGKNTICPILVRFLSHLNGKYRRQTSSHSIYFFNSFLLWIVPKKCLLENQLSWWLLIWLIAAAAFAAGGVDILHCFVCHIITNCFVIDFGNVFLLNSITLHVDSFWSSWSNCERLAEKNQVTKIIKKVNMMHVYIIMYPEHLSGGIFLCKILLELVQDIQFKMLAVGSEDILITSWVITVDYAKPWVSYVWSCH